MKLLKNDFCYFSYIEYEKKYFSPRRYVDNGSYVESNYSKVPLKGYGFLQKETNCFYKFIMTNEKGQNFYKGGKPFEYHKTLLKDNVNILKVARKDELTGKYRWIYGG